MNKSIQLENETVNDLIQEIHLSARDFARNEIEYNKMLSIAELEMRTALQEYDGELDLGLFASYAKNRMDNKLQEYIQNIT